jgi:hypothetical protein
MTLDDAAELIDYLRWHWGEAYRIHFFEPDRWMAQRRDTWESLTASTPLDLRNAIVTDYRASPVFRFPPSGPPPAGWIPRLVPGKSPRALPRGIR